jgi:hypothetical protein
MTCDQCDNPIPAARLAAMPRTRLCVACKALHDEEPLGPRAPLVSGALAGIDMDELLKIAHG